jgi:hypothetical protein
MDVGVNPELASDFMSVDINLTSPVDKACDLIQDEGLGKERELVNDEGDSHCVEVSGCLGCAPDDFSLSWIAKLVVSPNAEGRNAKSAKKRDYNLPDR